MKKLLWFLIGKPLSALCWRFMSEADKWQEIRAYMHPRNKIGADPY